MGSSPCGGFLRLGVRDTLLLRQKKILPVAHGEPSFRVLPRDAATYSFIIIVSLCVLSSVLTAFFAHSVSTQILILLIISRSICAGSTVFHARATTRALALIARKGVWTL